MVGEKCSVSGDRAHCNQCCDALGFGADCVQLGILVDEWGFEMSQCLVGVKSSLGGNVYSCIAGWVLDFDAVGKCVQGG